MKKVVFAFVIVLASLTFNSCTDNSLEELERNEQLQSTDPDEDGEVPTDPVQEGAKG
ncbi:hypothetical protein SAMN04489761_4639 [Tenacibaculum sp. MAR_2009_124]|uniref:hypothetical protein n=1 Tax=Tenacibaculum sp. MAR_2009_124 TaxID=1250059 RepID=UPI000897CC5D|nr:hypothetical protein [Tenacibaculum sp. MAR_2009_124]SED21211.1 hypothetical protein SAMN04489761_4639 [Tenacibaculum sp. MAR_2009_124]